MEFLPLRHVPLPDATTREYDRWVGDVAERLSDPATDRSDLCRDILTRLYYPGLADRDPADLPAAARVALLQMDPRNITLEPEYYQETDIERYARAKPVQWLWEMFDKSPVGENVHLGIRFRRALAPYVFRSVGRNFKAFHFVKWSFGYNLEIGDDVVVHRHVLLDDRGGIRLGNGVSVADYANIYSHSHALYDGRYVDSPRTVLGDGVRVTYHATILAGVHMEADSMLGAMAVATKDVPGGQVALGIPAAPRLSKPPRAERPTPGRTTDPLADPE